MTPLPPLRRISSSSDPMAEEALDLLEFLFPPEELEPREAIEAEFDGSPFETWIFEDEDEFLGGVVRGRVSPDGSWAWVVHVGLRPDLRGEGWGSQLLLAGIEALCSPHPGCKGTLLEVERLEDATSEEERVIRAGRLRFFEKLGAKKISSTYIQDAVREETGPVPLNLLWLARGNEDMPDFVGLIEDFYSVAFGLEKAHPYVLCTLGKLSLAEALADS